ncbi:MAG: patatin-like phospholipase family protein [Candidatus Paceibacterota bacterium]
MTPRSKTAIILIGGGMRSAHGGGFLNALGLQLGITNPDIIIGSSGNAGNALYYASRQRKEYEYLRSIWTELLSTTRFISYLRFYKIMNIDYLVDSVLKQQAPMDVAALERSPISYLIPITNATTGETRYVQREDGMDPFEIVRASAAIPVFYGKRVTFSGERYVDGGLGPTMVDHVSEAMRAGANRIVLVNNRSPRTRSSDAVMKVYAHLVSKGLSNAIRHDLSEHASCVVAEDTTVLCVEPLLPTGALTRSKEKLARTFEIGVQDALALEGELRTLLTV